jgi:hypothetical protein
MANNIQYKQFSELDFQTIKDSLKTHLRSQNELKDFDFEGSTINVILNLLAYNTQYNSYYLNMLASEKFISTAQKRESVVGAANNIGYVPFSRKSSVAYLSFVITPDIGYTTSIYIPKNTKFTSNIDGTIYTYLTTQDTTIVPVNGTYTVTDLEVKEGRFFSHKFTISATDKFLKIPNKNVDYSRLAVYVKQSPSDIKSTLYKKYNSLVDLSTISEVYFIQEGNGGLYEIYFGDGILGKSISVGNQVIVEYYTTDGSTPNGARSFTLSDEIGGVASIAFTSVTASSGGSMEESIDSIRISAPTNYQAQNRAITELDYEVLVKQIYPNAKEVSVTGGEKLSPKQFGKVFISILKSDLSILSDRDKSDIILQLNNKYASLTVYPQIIDPYIIRVLLDINVKYSDIGVSSSEISTTVFNTVKSFVSTELNTFKYVLRSSRFEAMVDNCHKNILSNTTIFTLYVDTSDVILSSSVKTINFAQPLAPNTLTSSIFTFKSIPNCIFLDTDGSGFASVYQKSNTGILTLVLSYAMSINYNTGLISYIDKTYDLYQLSIENSSGIKIYTKTSGEDIEISNNTVIFVNDNDIVISTAVNA